MRSRSDGASRTAALAVPDPKTAKERSVIKNGDLRDGSPNRPHPTRRPDSRRTTRRQPSR
jgi:hypothetical protein